jgi:biotin transport system substrate-specific component
MLGVMLAGMFLGSVPAVLAMLEFLAVGALGAPVFAGGGGGLAFLERVPTVGYLLAFPLAAYVVSRVAERSRFRFGRLMLAGLSGLAIIYACGVAYRAVGLQGDIGRAVVLGTMPFLMFDVVKMAIAAGLMSARPSSWFAKKHLHVATDANDHPAAEIEDWVIAGQPERPTLASHLDSCPSCRARANAFEHSFHLTARLVEPIPPPDGVRERLLKQISGRPHTSRFPTDLSD